MSDGTPGIVRDVWNAILNDFWMWVVVWGLQRVGKTTFKMQVAYAIYGDWDKVLQSFVFNLSGLLYKIDKGEPQRIWTRNQLHNRIPIILYDDFGGTSNKAATQHDQSWDQFKGAFDLLGTEISVLMASMVDPTEATFQIQEKYSHEVFIPQRGVYKYDRVQWMPDYNGWRPIKNKLWVETNTFEEVPRDVYIQYDEMRLSLVSEAKQRIKDTMAESQIEGLLKRLQPLDIQLLELIQSRGLVNYETLKKELGDDTKDVLVRCKARSLVIPLNQGNNYYKYDLTDLGFDILEAIKKQAITSIPLAPGLSVPTIQVKGMPQQATASMDTKKAIAESLRFQGLRVTESYDKADPDLVVWKDETTPSEVIAVKGLMAPRDVDVTSECVKEIEFAKKYSMDKIRVVCINTLSKKKLFDGLVGFQEKVKCEQDLSQQPKQEMPTQTAVDGTGKKNKIVLNLKLRTSPVAVTDRVAAVSDAFGVGIDDEKEFTIFDNVSLNYDDADLFYVTGDSGSGKSTFLKLFGEHVRNQGITCTSFEEIKPNDEEGVINSIGESEEEAFGLLATVGLSEAFLMLRKYKELSEGQKYRYKLAKLISTKAQVVLIDEFGATLDREMAKVLAFCIQKWARRNGKMVVVATTHRDLMEDFNPNILIDKKFGQTTEVKYFKGEPRGFSLLSQMRIEVANKDDYQHLKGFHYLAGNPTAIKGRYKLIHGTETIGIIVYTLSMRALRFRNQLFPEYKNNTQKSNAEIQRIARVIVHPKYRGIGLASELVRLTLPLANARIIETVAAMAKYNPFFEKAGMTLVGKMELQQDQKNILKFLERTGGKLSLLHNKPLCKAYLNTLNQTQFQELAKHLERLIQGVGAISPGRMDGLKKLMDEGNIIEVLMDLLPVERVYLYWVNPSWQAQNRTPTPLDQASSRTDLSKPSETPPAS
jgi:ABC-type lipoprotein export system ATPase subunit/GNAT superfamily N-acetyltransferase